MKKNNPGSCGFSLIELLVVVAIIGILSVVAIPAYFNHINRTRQANGVQQLIDMKTAQEKYYALYDRYASTIADAQYTSLLSFDPTDTQYYTYSVASTGTTTFTAEIHGNNSYLNNDCWRLTQAWADPSTCGTPAGLNFSVLADLFR